MINSRVGAIIIAAIIILVLYLVFQIGFAFGYKTATHQLEYRVNKMRERVEKVNADIDTIKSGIVFYYRLGEISGKTIKMTGDGFED